MTQCAINGFNVQHSTPNVQLSTGTTENAKQDSARFVFFLPFFVVFVSFVLSRLVAATPR
ncbi:MAG: hypothetical protein FJ279_35285 [Planctomycetes bacterium]|nr:hypothetical protein [Planctomycetota bacterium]